MIINIGLPKTGTTSLDEAVQILGYKRTKHHPVKYNTRVMQEADYSIPNLDAITNSCEDFYPQLYDLNPDLQFVLTTRDVDKWLNSWSKKNQTYDSQTPYQRENRIRIFGTSVFHEGRFRHVFERHHKNVIEFFNDKPHQLLILSLEDDNKLEKLCEFLDQPVPEDICYPHERKSKS